MEQRELGIRLAELRKAKGLTQEDLAARCRINVRTLQRIESGEVVPRSYTLQAILLVLEVDYMDFMGQFESHCHTQEDLESGPRHNAGALVTLLKTWSFAIYIAMLLVFSFLLSFGMPWYFYVLPVLPVLVVYLINPEEKDLETGTEVGR